MRKHRQYVMEEFATLRVDDIRYRIGGRKKLRGLGVVLVDLPGGRTVPLMLSRMPANLAGDITYALCPACGCRARVLRIVPSHEGLMCAPCAMKKLGAKYASQLCGHVARAPLATTRAREAAVAMGLQGDSRLAQGEPGVTKENDNGLLPVDGQGEGLSEDADPERARSGTD